MMTKKLFGHVIFYCWVIVFLIYYVFGSRGVLVGYTFRGDIEGVKVELAELEEDVRSLQLEIERWQKDHFYKEQIAREQLQLARPGDTVYYIAD